MKSGESRNIVSDSRTPAPVDLFNTPGQLLLDNSVQSIQLYKKGNERSAPIIRLNSNDRLNLRFDYLQFDNRQFRISFTHHDPDWSRSSLAQDFFQDGFYEITFGGGRLSDSRRPVYRTYTFEFPNDQIQFKASGNYMLQVEDFDSGNLLFSLPFFIHENEGTIRSAVQIITAPRRDMRITHLPESRFLLPDFVNEPEFDLQFYFFQNQFWGRGKIAGELDFSNPNESYYQLERREAFTGDYEFIKLELPEITQDVPRILSVDPTAIPPLVELNEDTQGFTFTDIMPGNRFGSPATGVRSRYANVKFILNPKEYLPPETEIYLVGDFNNWSLQSAQRLSYKPDLERWVANAIIKEGSYLYKYVLFEDNHVNDLYFDDAFRRTMQQYHTFAYFFDQRRMYYRLLQVNEFIGR
ncbi:MAG: type IX secretion system plug protein domain-containing protein [Balneolaceae bacterium]